MFSPHNLLINEFREWNVLNFQQVYEALPSIFKAGGLTILLTLVSIFFGLILGLLLALGRLSKNPVFNRASQFYIWFFRGSPLLLQIFFIYYALPGLVPSWLAPYFTLAQLPAAFIALSLNSGAYLAEIMRASILSIDKGQMEASKALGMSYTQAMRKIIIPQSYRRLIPPVGNEFIALLKDTSLVSAICLVDLMRVCNVDATNTGNAAFYVPCLILYLAMTTLFTFVFGRLEKKYSAYE